MPTPEESLPGRDASMPVEGLHDVLGTDMTPPFPAGSREALFGMGCFWGAERIFWRLPGVVTTAAGYSGGHTPNPTYEEVCSGMTGHNEVVRVVYDPGAITFGELLKAFFENHDPTQGMRQGNDVGTQYRSGIYVTDEAQRQEAELARDAFAAVLARAGHGPVTTEIADAGPFYYAEPYHQQYLHKNPGGYCNHGPNGFSCPIGLVPPEPPED